MQAIRFACLWYLVMGVVVGWLLRSLLLGEEVVGTTAVAMAFLVFSLFPTFGRSWELFVTPPNLLVYFSAEVPGFDIMGGVELLRNSRALDDLAQGCGLKRIGEFVSDDDLFDRSGPTWHAPQDGLATFDGLLTQHAAYPAVQAARNDLAAIRDRLRYAVEHNIQFCLLLRDVHATSGLEWERRKGFC